MLTREQVVEFNKPECQFLNYGACTTRACFVRGGYKEGPTAGFVPMCPYRQAVDTDAALRARITHLETALRLSSDDNLEYLKCQPGCDSYGHDEQCAVANPRLEFDRLRAENERLKGDNEEYDAKYAEVKLERDGLRAQVEALTRQLADKLADATEAWSTVNERDQTITARDEQLEIMEQQLTASQACLTEIAVAVGYRDGEQLTQQSFILQQIYASQARVVKLEEALKGIPDYVRNMKSINIKDNNAHREFNAPWLVTLLQALTKEQA